VVEATVRKTKKYYTNSKWKETSYIQLKEGGGRRGSSWVCHMLCRNCFIKHVTEGKIGGRITVTGRRGKGRKQLLDVLRKRENTLMQNRKHLIAFCKELALEEAKDQPQQI
jgi:hypothetical protein